ncbi:MAG: adenosylcobalamin-dependent ribonucleoside-diphosphate reductase [Deltaproteobacteria bacterium]|nr:adenosylcobalamin-dependent ribonucleoside-diphosphate reductase [Deltaproteobacteria bacterium]
MVDQNALLVLQKRYLIKDETGRPLETPEGLFRRVAGFMARAEENFKGGQREKTEAAFYAMLSNLEFLPNSPTLMNAGRDLGQLAACFVLPIEDSLDSIFEKVRETALIHQTGGGTGFSFSRLRPRNDLVASTMGRASGPVSFIKVFNMATEVIKQGGTRRGANMAVLRIDHPDIEEFVTIKRDPAELTNFNLSVAVTDAFMQAYDREEPFPLINPRTGKTAREVQARDLFQLIAESAWASGEPGVLFIDTINRANPTPHIGTIEATNPCGEQPLLPYESCCLGSLNLSKLVRQKEIDWERLRELVHLGVRFLDNVIEMGQYPVAAIDKITRANRKIGLGVMGFAHLLIQLGLAYDSPEAEKVGGQIMGFIAKESKTASRQLAEERGPFPNYPGSLWEKKGLLQRNATTTTVAPTGTLSLIAGCSSGIEPIYDIRYTRRLLGDIELELRDPIYEALKSSPFIRKRIPELFRSASQIEPLVHLRIQKAFQNHVDNAVSKTINLPEAATPETILNLYREAFRLGLKGTTIFRNKSRAVQVLSCSSQEIC